MQSTSWPAKLTFDASVRRPFTADRTPLGGMRQVNSFKAISVSECTGNYSLITGNHSYRRPHGYV